MKYSNKKLSIVLIGAGSMGVRWAEAIARHPRTSLSGVMDTDSDKAEALASQYGVPTFASLKDIPHSSAVLAACIAIPPAFSAEIIYAALAVGLHVIAEKPLAKNAEELRKSVLLAQRKKLTFMAGYNYRHFPHIRKAHELVEKGEIGSVMFIRARHGASGRPGYEHDWRHRKSLSGGGVLIDQAVHTIDLARWFLGEPKKIRGTLTTNFWKSGVEDNAFVHLETASRQIASLHASWTEWKPKFSFEIFGTEGYIIAEGISQYRQEERLIIAKRPADFLGSHVKEKTITFSKSKPKNSLADELTEFVSAIRESRVPHPSGQDALEILKIIDHIYKQS